MPGIELSLVDSPAVTAATRIRSNGVQLEFLAPPIVQSQTIAVLPLDVEFGNDDRHDISQWLVLPAIAP